MSTLIKNARIITAEQDYTADIYIEKEKISTIGNDLKIVADKIIDASEKYVIPGGIDVHTHMDMPFGGTTSSDDFETGTRAAAFGGTTSLVDFAIQSKGTKIREALDTWMKKAEISTVDFSLHMIVTDLPEAHLEDMNEMVREGVTSFKLFMAYPNVLMVDDATIFR
ncbi:MAG: amidohydrolase family protein, partial [Ignavibacteriales bacterium]|nr:amidohydrolase family protein [Ignavibacteriales bacterium]